MSSEQPNVGWVEALGEHASNPTRPRTTGDQVETAWCPACNVPVRTVAVTDNVLSYPDASRCPECDQPTETKTWTVSPLENRIKAQFEMWVRTNAKRAFQNENDVEEADRLRSVYISDYSSQYYNWGTGASPEGKYILAATRSPHGITYLTWLLLRRCHPEITDRLTARLMEANPKGFVLAYQWALGNSESAKERPETIPGSGASPKTAPESPILTGRLSPEEVETVRKMRTARDH